VNLVYALIIFSLLYVFQLYFNRNVFLKIITVTYLFLISSAVYFSFETYKGWPTQQPIKKAYLAAVEIIQPTKESSGAIYLWVYDAERDMNMLQSIFGYNDTKAPRSYVIPYSQKSSDEFSDAKKKLEEGMVVELNGENKKGINNEEAKDGAPDEQGNASASYVEDYDVPRIKIIPPDQVLRKP